MILSFAGQAFVFRDVVDMRRGVDGRTHGVSRRDRPFARQANRTRQRVAHCVIFSRRSWRRCQRGKAYKRLICMHAIATIDIESLPRDVDALLEVIAGQRRQFSAVIDSLRMQVEKMKRMTFGSRSERLARAKYRCTKDGVTSIVVAEAQPSPLRKSNASAGMLAQVLVSKYCDGIPLARQEKIFARHGVELARTTLDDWTLMSAEKLAVLMPVLKAHMLGATVLFADDTTLELERIPPDVRHGTGGALPVLGACAKALLRGGIATRFLATGERSLVVHPRHLPYRGRAQRRHARPATCRQEGTQRSAAAAVLRLAVPSPTEPAATFPLG